MTSNTAQVLGVMLRDLGRVNGAVTALNRNLATTKVVAAAAMTALAGAGVLRGMWAIVNASRALNDELSRMKMMGGEFAANIGNARAAAFGATASTPTLSAAQGVAMQREIAGLIGDPQLSAELLPSVSKAAYVASFYTKEAPETIAQNMLKMADIRGALLGEKDGKKVINWEALKPELEAAIKAMVIQGGMLKSGDLLGMIKQGSVPFRSMNADAAYLDMAELASTMGGQRVGTALTSMFQQFMGGKMTKQTAEALTAAGLLRPGDWTSGRSGGVVVTPAGTRRFSAMEGDPAAYFAGEGQAKIKAYAEANGISETAAIFRLFGRQTTQRLVTEILSSEPQLARNRQIAMGMPGYEAQYANLMRENLTTNITAFNSAWASLMQALGDAMVPSAISILQTLTGGLQKLTEWAAANPETVRILGETAAGIGAFAVALGAFAIGGAAASALGLLSGPVGIGALAMGLVSLAGALGKFPPWAVAMLQGAVAGAAVGGMIGGVPGALIGGAAVGGTAGLVAAPTIHEQLKAEEAARGAPSFAPRGPIRDEDRTPFMNWLRRVIGNDDRPVAVEVVNGRDLTDGVSGRQTDRFRRPQTGPSFIDPRMAPGAGFGYAQ